MKMELPQNPNVYLCLVGLLGAVGFVIEYFYNGRTITAIVVGSIGLILFIWGFIGLRKTQDLKDEEIEERIKLLQAKQKRELHEANKTNVLRL